MDNAAKRKVATKQGKALARKFNCPFLEVSALTGENVDMVFSSLVDELRYGKKVFTTLLIFLMHVRWIHLFRRCLIIRRSGMKLFKSQIRLHS